jgi:hypothetical protein
MEPFRRRIARQEVRRPLGCGYAVALEKLDLSEAEGAAAVR